jgi:hypothetical protein
MDMFDLSGRVGSDGGSTRSTAAKSVTSKVLTG